MLSSACGALRHHGSQVESRDRRELLAILQRTAGRRADRDLDVAVAEQSDRPDRRHRVAADPLVHLAIDLHHHLQRRAALGPLAEAHALDPADRPAGQPDRRAGDQALHVVEEGDQPVAGRPDAAARGERDDREGERGQRHQREGAHGQAEAAVTVHRDPLFDRRAGRRLLERVAVPDRNATTSGCAERRISSAVPVAAILPSFRSATRFEIAKQSSSSWVTITEVMPEAALQGVDQLADPFLVGGIQPGGGLVVEDRARLERDRARHAHPLAHAARELGGQQRLAARQAHRLETARRRAPRSARSGQSRCSRSG